MSESRDDSDDAKWRAALAPLREGSPHLPPGQEERLTRAIQQRRRSTRPLLLALAAMLLLALGGVAGRWSAGSGSTSTDLGEPRYLLLLFEGPAFDSLSSSHEARVAEYGNWARDLARRGQLVDAGELAPSEQRLGQLDTAGGDLLAGVFIVKAHDQAEAMAIASTCPHLKHGGGISVRLIRSS